MVRRRLWSAERRFGMVFKEITGTVPVFHPDVRVWEVADKEHGETSRAVLPGQLRAEPARDREHGHPAIVPRTRSPR